MFLKARISKKAIYRIKGLYLFISKSKNLEESDISYKRTLFYLFLKARISKMCKNSIPGPGSQGSRVFPLFNPPFFFYQKREESGKNKGKKKISQTYIHTLPRNLYSRTRATVTRTRGVYTTKSAMFFFQS